MVNKCLVSVNNGEQFVRQWFINGQSWFIMAPEKPSHGR